MKPQVKQLQSDKIRIKHINKIKYKLYKIAFNSDLNAYEFYSLINRLNKEIFYQLINK